MSRGTWLRTGGEATKFGPPLVASRLGRRDVTLLSAELATLALPETREYLDYGCLHADVAFRRLALSYFFFAKFSVRLLLSRREFPTTGPQLDRAYQERPYSVGGVRGELR